MKLKLLSTSVAIALASFAAQARAATITYDLNFVYTGNLPASAAPYLTATFRDTTDCVPACAPNTVQLVLTSSLEAPDEFFGDFYFNSISTVNTQYTSALSGAFTAPTISQFNNNAYAPAGQAGNFDVLIDFAQPAAGRFNAFDSALFTITGTGIGAATFNTPASGENQYWAAAHLQGIQPDCSAWIADTNGPAVVGGGAAPGVTSCGGTTTVPDSGSALALLGVAMLGLGYLRSRSR